MAVANDWFCDVQWGAQVDALIWKPCSPSLLYALNGFTTANLGRTDTRELIDQEFQWGVRAKGWADHPCNGQLEASYTYLNTDVTEQLANTLGVLQVINVQNFDNVKAREEWLYQRAGLRYLYDCCNSALVMTPYLGLLWVDIDLIRRVEGVATGLGFSFIDQSADVWAIGFNAGFIATYHWCCGLSVSAELGGLCGWGQRALRNRGVIPTEGTPGNLTLSSIEDRFSGNSACMSGYDIRAAISYSCALQCVEVGVEVGFEQQYYFEFLASNPVLLPGADAEHFSLGFTGPYFGFWVVY